MPVAAAALAEAIATFRLVAMFAALILITFVLSAVAPLALEAAALEAAALEATAFKPALFALAAVAAAVLANAALLAAAALAAVIVANNCCAEAGVTAGVAPLADRPVTVLD